MSDVVSRKEYNALLDKIAKLEDILTKFMRNTKDDLENLDADNFSESFKAKQDKASLEITKTAKELSVKMEDYDTSMFKMQSEIKQTAKAISLRVTKADVEKMISSAEFTVDVDGIKSEVKKYADEQISTAAETITAESITQTVSRAFFEVEKIDEEFDDEGKETDKIYYCSANGMHYYYNSILGVWRETSSKSIYSAFVQTDDGFEFNGDVVKISGELITEGTISAERIETDGLSCTKLYSSGIAQSYYAKMQSGVGDFGIYKNDASDDATPESEGCVWGLYNADPEGKKVKFFIYGKQYLGYDDINDKMWPAGSWDFSAAKVTFKDDGVNAIAVFG